MKKTLEELWYSYLLQNSPKMDRAQEKTLKRITEDYDGLIQILDETQKEKLRIYETHLNELSDLSEKRAFIKGVRFAASFLVETLYIDE